MPADVIHSNQLAIYGQPDGIYTAFEPLGIGKYGAGEKTFPGANITPVYINDAFGRPVVLTGIKEAPSGLPSNSVVYFEEGSINYFQQKFNDGTHFAYQIRYNPGTRLDNPGGWQWIIHYGRAFITNQNSGEGPMVEYNGAPVQSNSDIVSLYASVIIRPELGVLASNETQQINRVALVSDIALSETIGYAGADTVIVATTNAVTLGIANVLLSINGGGLFEAFTNDPFAADEDIGPVAAAFVTADEIRTIVGRDTTDGAAKAEIAYAQATVPTLSAATWTTVDITQSVNGDTVQALGWITPTMLLAGVAGDIYLSTDFGESFPDAAVFAGTDAINRIIAGANKRIWVVGENGLILLAKNNSTTFEVKSAPTAGSVQCITEAENGAVYAGIGAIIYRSTDQASSVAGWEALRDFGTNKVVKQVALGAVRNGGDAQVIRVVIDDTAAGTGAVYISIDGGTTFEQVPTQVNTGYNDAAFSSTDDNKGFLVGDISAGAGVIHKYQPSTL